MPQLLRDIVVVDTKYIIPAIHIVVTIIFGYIVLRLIDSALSRLKFVIPQSEMLGGVTPRIEQRAETLSSVLRSVVKGILILLVLIQIGWELNYSFYPLLASAGIVGLAIGFGAQSLVKDVISGFFILFEDQFGVGDVVKIGDFSGVVEKMTLRATVLRNLEGQVYVVPNGNIQHVIVTTKEWARAVLDVSVRHEEPLGKVFDVLQRVGNRLAEDMPGRVLEKPTILGVEKLDDSGVTIRSIVKTPPFKNADVSREWRRRIIEEFDRSGIRFVQKEGIVGRPS